MTDERPLPRDVESEKALLASVLVAPEAFSTVAHLTDRDFAKDAHKRLWRAYRRLWDDGTAIDPVTVRHALEAAGDLDEVPLAFVMGLDDGMPRSANIEHYAAAVQRASVRRQTAVALRAKLEAMYADDEDQAAQAETALAALETLGTAPIGALDADGQIDVLLADLERDATGPRVTLGLPAIDGQLDGVRPGEILGLMARPGLGKTLVLCHAITGLVESLGVVCFSLEMPAPQIVRRLARMRFGLSNYHLQHGALDVSAYREWFAGLRLDGTPGLSVQQMAARVRRQKALGFPVRVVCVDHLGLIGGDRTMSTYDRVSTHARELKEMAKREDCAVILLIQVNRESGGDGSRELHLGSARDSGVVEEALDYLVAMRRLDRSTTLSPADRERYRDVLFAKTLKHRHGGVSGDEVAYRLHGETLRLSEDLHMRVETNDLAAIAARAGGGRR